MEIFNNLKELIVLRPQCSESSQLVILFILPTYRNYTNEDICWELGQLRSKASTDMLLQIYRKNFSAEASDYLISIFTKIRVKYTFKLINKVCHPKRKFSFLSKQKRREDDSTSKSGKTASSRCYHWVFSPLHCSTQFW